MTRAPTSSVSSPINPGASNSAVIPRSGSTSCEKINTRRAAKRFRGEIPDSAEEADKDEAMTKIVVALEKGFSLAKRGREPAVSRKNTAYFLEFKSIISLSGTDVDS